MALYYFIYQLFSDIQVATLSLVPWTIIVMRKKTNDHLQSIEFFLTTVLGSSTE